MAALEGCGISHPPRSSSFPAYAALRGAEGHIVPGGIPCPTTYNAILYAALEASSDLQGACSSMHCLLFLYRKVPREGSCCAAVLASIAF